MVDRIFEQFFLFRTLIIESASQDRSSSATSRACGEVHACCITRFSTPWAPTSPCEGERLAQLRQAWQGIAVGAALKTRPLRGFGDATCGSGFQGLVGVAGELVGNAQRRNAQKRNAICNKFVRPR